MTSKRIVIPLLFVATVVAGAMTGCHNYASSTATPTPSPVPTCSNCTPVPTAAPTGPTPTPSPTPTSYQPLVVGDQWTYSCTNASTATKTIASGATISGTATLNDTLSFSSTALIPVSLIAFEANDGLGNTSVYQWNVGASTTLVSPPGLEYGTNHPTPSAYQGPVTGTITTTDTGNVGSLTVPLQMYNNVELFKSINPNPVFQALQEVDVWAVLNVGPIQLGFPDASGGAVTCSLTAVTLH